MRQVWVCLSPRPPPKISRDRESSTARYRNHPSRWRWPSPEDGNMPPLYYRHSSILLARSPLKQLLKFPARGCSRRWTKLPLRLFYLLCFFVQGLPCPRQAQADRPPKEPCLRLLSAWTGDERIPAFRNREKVKTAAGRGSSARTKRRVSRGYVSYSRPPLSFCNDLDTIGGVFDRRERTSTGTEGSRPKV